MAWELHFLIRGVSLQKNRQILAKTGRSQLGYLRRKSSLHTKNPPRAAKRPVAAIFQFLV